MSCDTATFNCVLDKIVCLYELAWDEKSRHLKLSDEEDVAPRIPVDTAVTISYKIDGECCYIDPEGVPRRRRDIKAGRQVPSDWMQTGKLDVNGHTIGFIPIATDASAKFMKQALNVGTRSIRLLNADLTTFRDAAWDDYRGCTLEFVGPKVQGNPYKLSEHGFYVHGEFTLPNADTIPWCSYRQLKQWFVEHDGPKFEGLVFKTDGGELYKITRNHFQLAWP